MLIKTKRVLVAAGLTLFIALFAISALHSSVAISKAQNKQTVVFTQAEARVVDGDTVVITTEGKQWKIRLQGIDAPETKQTCMNKADNVLWLCGKKSGEALSAKLKQCSKQTICFVEITGTDKYRRSIGVIKQAINGKMYDINQSMVSEGWAVAYKQYSTAYVADEQQAKEHKRGIWNSRFTSPSEYRHAKKKPKNKKEEL